MNPEEYKTARKRLGTQAEVASLLGVNRVTVAKRESGTMTITNEAVLAIQSLRSPKRSRKSENVRPLAPADNKTPTKQENV
jgi:DNA-binding XRE family transcriptional regulator